MARLRSLSDVDVALAFGLLLSASTLSSEPYRQVTAEEITVRFVGQEFTDYVHLAHVFEKDGRLTSFSVGKQGSGMWRVEDDRLCLLPEAFPERATGSSFVSRGPRSMRNASCKCRESDNSRV
jgi:hypothetical protein